MWFAKHIAPLALELKAACLDPSYQRGVSALQRAMSAHDVIWYAEDAERFAQSLIVSNSNPNFREGVAALAHALGARNVRVLPGAPTIAQLANGVEAVTR